MTNEIDTSTLLSDIEIIRSRVNQALRCSGLLLGIEGQCTSRVSDIVTIDREASNLSIFPSLQPGLVTIQRDAVWKPRSNPHDWNGDEQTNPDGALELIKHISSRYAIASMEFGSEEQITKYSHLLSFAWIGARSENNIELMYAAAGYDPGLPLGIKNGLSGDIDNAQRRIDDLRDIRGKDGAEVALIYRGGENAKTPTEWEEQYLHAIEATNGRLIVDSAHGSEMAHDPNKEFAKSNLGQIACLEHIIGLAEDGVIPAGVMIEASDTERVIDPVISFEQGADAVWKLAKIFCRNTTRVKRLDV